MNYVPLAPLYDAFTRDVPYAALADFYDALLNPGGAPGRMYLDLCCGTGTLTWLLARRGREMIGVDASPEMLAVAQSKAQAGAQPEVPPLFLCQEAAQLDLYGTVQGALCSLDGMNYLPPEELPERFDAMMRARSEDAGLEVYPDGYYFTEGEFDAMYEPLLALAEGEMSGIVECDYGYQIIFRPLMDPEHVFETDADTGDVYTLRRWAAGMLFNNIAEERYEAAAVEYAPEFAQLDIAALFGA